MPVRPDQLAQRLKGEPATIWLVGGNEPLVVDECARAIRAGAREQGVTERVLLEVERGFDWNALAGEGMEQSLFASRRLVELRLPGGKPGNAGSKAIQSWVDRPPADTWLLITAFDAEARDLNKAKWVKALDKAGVYVPVYPIDPEALPRWIRARLQQRGVRADDAAVALLAERVQGNLLAAQQEIDKLALLAGEGRVDEATIEQAVGDNARFQTFGMVDAALAGDAEQALRALRGLQSEGVELVMVMGALLWQLRQLAGLSFEARKGGPASALQRVRTWPKKRQLLGESLKRHTPSRWDDMLTQCARIDRQIKGRAPGDPWLETERLLLTLSGA